MAVTILDPTREAAPHSRPLAPRDGKPQRIALVDIRKPRGDVFLDELEALLAATVDLVPADGVKPHVRRSLAPDVVSL